MTKNKPTQLNRFLYNCKKKNENKNFSICDYYPFN